MNHKHPQRPQAPFSDGSVVHGVVIDGIDDEGRGRGHVDHWDLAVRGAVPGDVAVVHIERLWHALHIAQGVAHEGDVERGPLHHERTCPHAGPCAGCPLHGIDAGFVLDGKRGRVAKALADVGLGGLVPDIASVVESKAPRQKVKLTAGLTRAGERGLGLYAPHSHDLADATACPHHDPRINLALATLTATLAEQPDMAPILKAVIARAFVEGVGVVVVTSAAVNDTAFAPLRALVDRGALASIAVRVDTARSNSIVSGAVAQSAGPQALTPLEGGAPASVDAFCQTDPMLAAAMYARAASFLTSGAPAD
ncbi:MAG TPA: hypothetical protein VGO62_01320, partial [Myxococcota bacterium]